MITKNRDGTVHQCRRRNDFVVVYGNLLSGKNETVLNELESTAGDDSWVKLSL